MKGMIISLTIFCLVVVASSVPASFPGIRPKRVSDQRLAELQTLSALARVKPGGLFLPLGLGDMDIHQIGRKRRASMEAVNDYLSRREESADAAPIKTGNPLQYGSPLLLDSFPWGAWRESRKEAEPVRRDGNLAILGEGANYF